jgi:5'-methylthioadenosine phosphorylase
MSQKILGVVGGSGLYDIEGMTNIENHRINTTPFGNPSDTYVSGELNGTKIIFLPRHGVGHRFLPSEVNYRANIYGFKKLGVEFLLSVSAVGSLKKEIAPGDMVLPDQFYDRTMGRKSTFFGEGIVAHVGFGDPICKKFQAYVHKACKKVDVKTHLNGTYVCMEGPLFSTRAESNFYRSLDASVIGMTNLTEAKLAREAGISYVPLSLSTDYDCWHEEEEAVTGMAVVEVMKKNVGIAKKIIAELAKDMIDGKSPFHDVLKYSIVTDMKIVPPTTREKLSIFLQGL